MMFVLAWTLAGYLVLALVAVATLGVQVSRYRKLIRAMAERIDIQSQLLSEKAERGRIIPPQGGSGTAPPTKRSGWIPDDKLCGTCKVRARVCGEA